MGSSQSDRARKYGHFEYSSKEAGSSPILRNIGIPFGRPLITELKPGINTMLKVFEDQCKRIPDYPMVGSREKLPENQWGHYRWKTYREVQSMSSDLAKGIKALDLDSSIEYREAELHLIGIFAKTREEWLITDIATWQISVTNVPLYDTLNEENIAWIFEQTQLKSVFVAGNKIGLLVKLKSDRKLPSLQSLISYDPELTPGLVASCKASGLKVYTMEEVIQAGKSSKIEKNPCKPQDLITICYTSGTTGKGKGAELTHEGFAADAIAVSMQHPIPASYYGLPALSFLPLAHVFERVLTYLHIVLGHKIGYYHGEVTELTSDLTELRPMVIVAVPRVFLRVYEKMMDGIAKTSGLKRKMVERALKVKREAYEKDGSVNDWFYDKLVLKKFREALGGQIATLISAAAPLDPKIIANFRIMLSCSFLQGYGQTETSGAISHSLHDDCFPGTVGPPVLSNELKTIDVPEMNYTSKDIVNGEQIPRGELCVRGPNVMRGYFKDPEKTKEAMDHDGWLHTGDIVMLRNNGIIRIIDRKKNFFKLSQGEYVAPEKIENVLTRSRLVAQLFVHGDSFQTYLIAIVVPNKEGVMRWATDNNLGQPYEDIIKSADFKKVVLEDFSQLSKAASFAGYEFVKKVYITSEQFSIENNTLTPTMKVKRGEAKKMHLKEIEKLYAEPLEA